MPSRRSTDATTGPGARIAAARDAASRQPVRRPSLLGLAALGAQVAGEDLLADADRVRGDLDELVAVDELHRRLDRVLDLGREQRVLVLVLRAHVGELLLFRDVHVEIALAVVL